MAEDFYARHPVEVEVSGTPGSYFVSGVPSRITSMIFEKAGARLRVSRRGVEMLSSSAEVEAEATELIGALGPDWGKAWEALHPHGYTYLGPELVESIAPDLLGDGLEHAGRAAAHAQLACDTDGEAQNEAEFDLARDYRKSVLLLAAAAEAFINEFIALNLPERLKEVMPLRPPVAKWAVAVELATGLSIENEAPFFSEMAPLFALRNKLMHFTPRRQMRWLASATRPEPLHATLMKERRPLKHCRPVVDGAATLVRIGPEKPVYDLPAVVKSAFEDTGAPVKEVRMLTILAKPVRRIIRGPAPEGPAGTSTNA